jgi:hypothetical protein
MRHGGRILTGQLPLHETDIVCCVPGESYTPLLGGLHDTPIPLITCRHETGAALPIDPDAITPTTSTALRAAADERIAAVAA